jgi:hypothetical protein
VFKAPAMPDLPHGDQYQPLGLDQSSEGGLIFKLAGVLEQLLTDQVEAKDAVGKLEAVYHGAVVHLRLAFFHGCLDGLNKRL